MSNIINTSLKSEAPYPTHIRYGFKLLFVADMCIENFQACQWGMSNRVLREVIMFCHICVILLHYYLIKNRDIQIINNMVIHWTTFLNIQKNLFPEL